MPWTTRTLSVVTSVSLDGVAQGLGRPDEDTRGGFTEGAWGQGYTDGVMARESSKGMARPGDMLFGHRTWEDFMTAWGSRADGNPFSAHLNAATKYVVPRTSESADTRQNSILLRGEAPQTVAELKAQPGRDLSVIGSAALVRDLQAVGLVDHDTLLIRPLTLGPGARLFPGPGPLTSFALAGSVAARTGVIIAEYDRV